MSIRVINTMQIKIKETYFGRLTVSIAKSRALLSSVLEHLRK